jgi:4-hydroxy-3-methylbut-2-enyl diphosphate reductase IspH
MNSTEKLLSTRKESIKELVERYKKLVDETCAIVNKSLPEFEDKEDDKGVIIQTGEQRLFHYIEVRNQALDNANKMLFKINELELELADPEAFYKEKEQEHQQNDTETRSWTKRNAIKKEE